MWTHCCCIGLSLLQSGRADLSDTCGDFFCFQTVHSQGCRYLRWLLLCTELFSTPWFTESAMWLSYLLSELLRLTNLIIPWFRFITRLGLGLVKASTLWRSSVELLLTQDSVDSSLVSGKYFASFLMDYE